MNAVKTLSRWTEQRWSWTLLMISAIALESCALYFQHIMGLPPCIMCVYERLAVLGIIFIGLVPLVHNNAITRCFAFVGWGVSSVWGYIIAAEHADLITNANPFFATCEFEPNFPSWMPLHHWVPAVFAATGDCDEADWAFVGLNMPEWLMIIFAIYGVILALVLSSRLIDKKHF